MPILARRAIMSTTTTKVPIHHLPLAPHPLQRSLRRLDLQPQPSAQRRSTTFKASTPGVWARVAPLWTAWPLRITKEEIAAMGIDLDAGGQVSVEDVLARDDPIDVVSTSPNGLDVKTSKHRSELRPSLLGLSELAVKASLPHLDVGDAVTVSRGGEETDSPARNALVDVLSGRQVLVGKDDGYGPWSTRYCGHQFGTWAGQLGDGRAISLIETQSPEGVRTEIQLKGAGRTPFSRSADGLAVLRSGVREFLGCEAVAALGIPTTRALALLTLPLNDLPVIRENGPEPTSLTARLAPSFIRIGHFEALNPSTSARSFSQIFLGGGGWMQEESDDTEGPLGGQGNLEALRELAEWCKVVIGYEGDTKGWVKEVAKRNAEMVAGWQVYGWMHGVLNTDNISVLGLTIDYGPYAFMDIWDEGHICNHSDPSGLYSYRRQPERVLFALDKLVQAVAPLIGYEAVHGRPAAGWSEGKTESDVKEWEEKAKAEMQDWQDAYWDVERATERKGWLRRFGLRAYKKTDDRNVIYDFLTLLHTHSMDFHTSLRLISAFDPIQSSDKLYTKHQAAKMVSNATTNLSMEAVESATAELEHWLDLYAKRVLDGEEVARWTEAEGAGEWQEKRRVGMERANPRFVLRQWVLEELIADLERTGTADLTAARKKLSRVLEMATHPFEAYEDDETPEGAERARLCGLGGKDMLGFQCSCSS